MPGLINLIAQSHRVLILYYDLISATWTQLPGSLSKFYWALWDLFEEFNFQMINRQHLFCIFRCDQQQTYLLWTSQLTFAICGFHYLGNQFGNSTFLLFASLDLSYITCLTFHYSDRLNKVYPNEGSQHHGLLNLTRVLLSSLPALHFLSLVLHI